MGQFTAQEVLDEIKRQAPIFGVEPGLAQAFFHAENSADGVVDPKKMIRGDTTSPVGARGVMQTMPRTEEGLKHLGFLPKDWTFSPEDLRGQVQAGLAALQEMRGRQKDKNDPMELAAMYNGGTSAWQNYRAGALDRIPAETRNYFTKIQTALGGGRKDMTPQQMESHVVQQPSAAPTSTSSGSRASTSTRSNSYDPVTMAAALNSGFQINKSGGTIDVTMGEISKGLHKQAIADANAEAAISQFATLQGQATTASAAVEASAAARRAGILAAANLNPDVMTNQASMAMDKIIEGTVALEQQGAEIDQRMAVGFFDNPLEWLVNQTRLPGMVGQYNAEVRKQNRAIETTRELQGLASTQLSLSQAVDADLITAAGTAKAASDAALAQAKLSEIQSQTAGNAIRNANLGLAAEQQRFRNYVDINELTKQVRSENTSMSEKDAERAAAQIQLDAVNKWLKMIGSNQQYDTVTFKAIPAKTREELLVSAGTGRIGRNLTDSITAIETLGDYSKIAAEGDAAAVTWLKGTMARAQAATTEELKLAEKQASITGKVIKKEAFLAANIDKLQELYTAETTNMRGASDSNPMKISYDYMVKDPGLQQNPVVQFLQQYGPTSPAPIMNKVDEKDIVKRFSTEVLAGRTTSGDAAKAISEFYKTGARLTAERTKYPLFGIDRPTNGYTVVIPESGLFDRSQIGGKLDLTNPAEVERYLIKDAAQTARMASPAGPYRPFFDPLGLTKAAPTGSAKP